MTGNLGHDRLVVSIPKRTCKVQFAMFLVLFLGSLTIGAVSKHGFWSPLTQVSTVSSEALTKMLGNEFCPLTWWIPLTLTPLMRVVYCNCIMKIVLMSVLCVVTGCKNMASDMQSFVFYTTKTQKEARKKKICQVCKTKCKKHTINTWWKLCNRDYYPDMYASDCTRQICKYSPLRDRNICLVAYETVNRFPLETWIDALKFCWTWNATLLSTCHSILIIEMHRSHQLSTYTMENDSDKAHDILLYHSWQVYPSVTS